MDPLIHDQIRYCEFVMTVENQKKRPKASRGCHTWRYQMAKGMRTVLRDILARQRRKEQDERTTRS